MSRIISGALLAGAAIDIAGLLKGESVAACGVLPGARGRVHEGEEWRIKYLYRDVRTFSRRPTIGIGTANAFLYGTNTKRVRNSGKSMRCHTVLLLLLLQKYRCGSMLPESLTHPPDIRRALLPPVAGAGPSDERWHVALIRAFCLRKDKNNKHGDAMHNRQSNSDVIYID